MKKETTLFPIKHSSEKNGIVLQFFMNCCWLLAYLSVGSFSYLLLHSACGVLYIREPQKTSTHPGENEMKKANGILVLS